jgi:hypothetical protein
MWWGSKRNCTKGIELEELIDSHNVVLLNDGSPTHFSSRQGTFSAIDLSFASTSIATSFNWRTTPELHQSDHFPILISTSNTPHYSSGLEKWDYQKANWEQFGASISITEITGNIEHDVATFSQNLIKAAEQSVPKKQAFQRKKSVPWWNSDCKTANKNKKKAFYKFRLQPTIENLNEFKRCRAIERRVHKLAKKQSWTNFVSSITSNTTATEMWNKIKAVSGKPYQTGTPILEVDGKVSTDAVEVAEIFAHHYAQVSSTQSYTNEFQTLKNTSENETLDFTSDNTENYNQPFTMIEL